MKTEELTRYGFPNSIINIWKRSGIVYLSHLQQSALNSGALFSENLLILAPTSSGKTFCGELSAIKTVLSGKRAVFLVPLKAIAEEKYEDCLRKYSASGMRVVLSTRDRRKDDDRIIRGDFDLGIIIYEKFNRFLTRNFNILSAIELVVFDELDIYRDPQRGEVAHLILTKVRSSKAEVRMIGLGREDFPVADIPGFMNFQVVSDNHRPVELRKGVLYRREFIYRDSNRMKENSEELNPLNNADIDDLSDNSELEASLKYLCGKGEQAIVFLKSKASTVNAALDFSSKVALPRSKKTIDLLSDLEETSNFRALMVSLERGIGFHNSDLTEFESKAIIDGFRNGDIRLLFSTTTLSSGVNLPIKNVFIEPLKFGGTNNISRPVEIPMEYSEVESISGRAGRWGIESEFGRAILLARNQFEREVLWSRYIDNYPQESVEWKIILSKEAIVDLIASGVCSTLEQLKGAMKQMSGKADLDLTGMILWLVDKGLLKYEAEKITVTSLGVLTAITGLKSETVVKIAERLESGETVGDLHRWVRILSFSKEISQIMLPVWFNYWYRDNAALWVSGDDDNSRFSLGDAKAEYFSGLLSDWIEGVEHQKLEKKYRATAGLISDIAERFSWVLYSAGEVAQIMGHKDIGLDLHKFSERVKYGLPTEGINLASLKVFGLGRIRIMELIRDGFHDEKDVYSAGADGLPNSIPERVRLALFQKCEDIIKNRNLTKRNKGERKDESKRPISTLILYPEVERGKMRININGTPTLITYKSFHYLKVLAKALTNGGDGWVHRLDLEDGDNQWSYLHRLRTELKPCLPKGVDIIENDRHGYYRLCALPEGIVIEEKEI